MVSTCTLFTPDNAATSRAATGGTAAGSAGGGSDVVVTLRDGTTGPARRRTGLLDLSDELLSYIWELFYASSEDYEPLAHLTVNKKVFNIALPHHAEFYILEGDVKAVDRDLAGLLRHPDWRKLVRRCTFSPESGAVPTRTVFATIARLSNLRSLILRLDDEPLDHRMHECFGDLAKLPHLYELLVTGVDDYSSNQPAPSFPALRRLITTSSRLAAWVLATQQPVLSSLELHVSISDTVGVPSIPWKILRRLSLAASWSEEQMNKFIAQVESFQVANKLEDVRLLDLSISVSPSDDEAGVAHLATFYTQFLLFVGKLQLRSLRITEALGGLAWSFTHTLPVLPSVRTFSFASGSMSRDSDKWASLACLLRLFPDLQRITLSGFTFCDLVSVEDAQFRLYTSGLQLAIVYPTLAAILHYLGHTGVQQLRLVDDELDVQVRATRIPGTKEFELERWTVEGADQSLKDSW